MQVIGKGGRTGKQDIEGTEIQDGDVMLYSEDVEKYPFHTDPYCVKWNDVIAGFECESKDNYMLAAAWHKMKIIGNMRTNPELMNHEYDLKPISESDLVSKIRRACTGYISHMSEDNPSIRRVEYAEVERVAIEVVRRRGISKTLQEG